jgi:hypothetical protein
MTQIGALVLDQVHEARKDDYAVQVVGTMETAGKYQELRELFDLAPSGTAVIWIPGRRPVGVDHTIDSLCTWYVTFDSGDKLRSGFHLIQGLHRDERKWSQRYGFVLDVFYLGSEAELCESLLVTDLEVGTSDWGL